MAGVAKPKSVETPAGADTPGRVVKCPICGEPAVPEFFPFSSKHCANVDLNRWLTGAYFISADQPPQDAPSEPEDDEG